MLRTFLNSMTLILALTLTTGLIGCSGAEEGAAAGSNSGSGPAPIPLSISPTSYSLIINDSINFAATGGTGAYAYTILPGGIGSINFLNGTYTAPAFSGIATVQVTDSSGSTATADININGALSISPVSKNLPVNGTQVFSASGGIGTLSFSIVSGGGSINSSTGVFTAPNYADAIVVRVTDSGFPSHSADANVVVSSLGLSPASWDLVVNESKQFNATGGTSPFTYSVSVGGGSIDSSGLFTASLVAETVTVKIVDSVGNAATSVIHVHSPLNISPTTSNLAWGAAQDFSASGGIPPYTYSLSGIGSITATGTYTSPNSSTTDTVHVTDSGSRVASATVTVVNTLAINPTSIHLPAGSGINFSGSGGRGASFYNFSITSGSGTLDDGTGGSCTSSCATGDYTAPDVASTDIVRLSDGAAISDATIYVYEPISISPSTLTLASGNSATYSSAGGFGAKVFSIASGAGLASINSSSGTLLAGSSAGNVVVRVTDSIGNFVDSNLAIVNNLSISPKIAEVSTNSTLSFSTTLGSAPYNYAVITSGGGSINSTTGAYTAPSSAKSVTVRVTDSMGVTSDATVSVVAPVKLVSAEYFNCLSFTNNKLRCWGNNAYGQLGVGSTAAVGDNAGEMGNALAFINVGTGRTVKDFALGANHVCAIRDDNSTVCWGRNDKGQLGRGNTSAIGDGPGEMGDNLVAVDLGTGRYAKSISAGGLLSCAILDNNDLKCWGTNSGGAMGIGKSSSTSTGGVPALGDGANEMGNNLLPISLGTGRYAKSVTVMGLGSSSKGGVCAILDNNDLKCWGDNSSGQLGVGDKNARGDGANEMGDNLLAINLGTNLTAKSIATARSSVCAIIHDSNTGSPAENSVKCWGYNTYGTLGLGDTSARGDATGEMGTSLPFVNFGTGITAKQLVGGYRNMCALLSNDTVKCWGENGLGQSGQGNTNMYGSASNLTVSAMPAISIGAGFTPGQISVGRGHACSLSTAGTGMNLKCWGTKSNGAIGSGDYVGTTAPSNLNLGDASNEMGANLPFISY